MGDARATPMPSFSSSFSSSSSSSYWDSPLEGQRNSSFLCRKKKTFASAPWGALLGCRLQEPHR
eukprot:3900804-Pyramimonas_sp.AAC.1